MQKLKTCGNIAFFSNMNPSLDIASTGNICSCYSDKHKLNFHQYVTTPL